MSPSWERFLRFRVAQYRLYSSAVTLPDQAAVSARAHKCFSLIPPESFVERRFSSTRLLEFFPLIYRGANLRVYVAGKVALADRPDGRADLVAISKSDLIATGRMAGIVNTLQAHCKSVLQLSTHKNLGLKEVVEAIGETS